MDPAAFLVLATTSLANLPQEQPCGKFSDIQEVIIMKYGEKPLLSLVEKNGIQLILYANPKTNTWTVVAMDVLKDMGCLIDSGTNLKLIPWKGYDQ